MDVLEKSRYFLRLISLIFLMCIFVCGCGENVKVEVENISDEREAGLKEEKELFSDVLTEISGETDLVRTFSWGPLPEGYEIVSWRGYEQSTRYYEDRNEQDSYGNVALPEKLLYNYFKVRNLNTRMYGLVDWNGEFVIEPKYSSLDYAFIEDGEYYFKTEYEGESALVNINGETSDVARTVSANGWDIEGGSKDGYKIINPEKEVVGGPYKSVKLYHDVFYHELDGGRLGIDMKDSRQGDGIGFYDSVANINYMIDDSKLSDRHYLWDIIRDNKSAIYEIMVDSEEAFKYTYENYLFNYETNEMKFLFEGSFIATYGSTVIYKSNGTYKCVDLNGNNILDERYFEYTKTCGGALLKRESGEWLCLGEDGKILEISKDFAGAGEEPDTYRGYPIRTYYRQDGIPCVMIEDESKGEFRLYALK